MQTVRVDADCSIAEVLHLASPSAACLTVGRRSSIVVVLSLEGGLESHHLDVVLEDGATCDLVTLQMVDAGAACRIMQRADIGAEARCQWRQISLGGARVDHSVVSRAVGPGAVSGVEWIFFARGNERYSLDVRNVFTAPSGRGEVVMRGVAQDTANVAARGTIDIGLQGRQTQTYLTQSVLMLDATATVHAVPGLEITTNDVKASHSATVTRVTPEDLFYFASRGVPAQEARRMYVEGFVGDLAGRIADADVRSRVLAAIAAKYDRPG